tara:strand:+ start:6874 stop:8493 length:1620 start_codon:yes stop_codon:yes gene_type:complete
MKKFKSSLVDLFKLSKLTKTKNKRARIIFGSIISNVIVFFDIVIISVLTSIFSDSNFIDNFIVSFFVNNLYLLPFIVVLRFLFIYFEKINVIKLKIEIEKNLRLHLMEEIFDKGNYSISDAYFYVNTISNQVASFYGTFAVFLGSALQILAYTTYLLITNTQTILVFLVGVIFLIFPTIYLTKLGRKYSHNTYIFGQEISSEIEKVLDNLYLIKIINYVEKELKNFKKSLFDFYSSSLNNLKLGTINAIIPNFVTVFIVSILLVFFNFAKVLTLDFIGIVFRLFQSLGVFNSNLHLLNAYHIYTEKLFQIETNRVASQSDNFIVDKDMDNDLAIKLNNISFKYFNEEEYIFSDLSLDINKGQHTIITGPNGSGKSTLLALFSGIIYASEGKSISYTSKFSYVSASPMILNSNLKENLLYGVEKEIDEEVLNSYIEEFKLFNENQKIALDKEVSNKALSTGQMQKISFIRALLSGSDVLLLDESTSNLDYETKVLIFEVLDKRDLTIINATHNPDEFLRYDQHIKIVIKEGKRQLINISS